MASYTQGDQSDRDQTLADTEQTVSDRDQTAADTDQTAAETDQAASDSDQAASDRDLAVGGDPGVHQESSVQRDRGTEQRKRAGNERQEAATVRDEVAKARDAVATERDHAAALHDRALAARDDAWPAADRAAVGDLVARAETSRARSALDRVAAAEGRSRAAADRSLAEGDRRQAARDRSRAQEDRYILMRQLAIAEIDELTGAHARAPGLMGLEHEIDRARRDGGLLTAAYVDVVGLKAMNDSHGHAAGDLLLRRVVDAIRLKLRSYDSVIRVGGDEFLCVMSGTNVEDARRRFKACQAALAAGDEPCEIKVGFAALSPKDSAADLVANADADMPRSGR